MLEFAMPRVSAPIAALVFAGGLACCAGARCAHRRSSSDSSRTAPMRCPERRASPTGTSGASARAFANLLKAIGLKDL
jgi:hypothetical protein